MPDLDFPVALLETMRLFSRDKVPVIGSYGV